MQCLEAMAGIFYGKTIAPRVHPKNARIENMEHPIFAEQLQHLQYFESESGDAWFDKMSLSRLRQSIMTARAFAEHFFETHRALGEEGRYFTMHKLNNRPVEGSHGELRQMNKMTGPYLKGANAIQRMMSDVNRECPSKPKTGTKRAYFNKTAGYEVSKRRRQG